MRKLTLPMIVRLMAVLLLLTSCNYHPESMFTLAADSRLPRWFTPPSNLKRSQLTVSLAYYVSPFGRSATATLIGPNDKVILEADGKMRGGAPTELKVHPRGFPSGYPVYEVITMNGVTEIVEHQKPGPYFYITDDQSVWKELIVEGEGRNLQ